jgi:signal transduction histidine kinase/ActR/RegA family two-component response regulator
MLASALRRRFQQARLTRKLVWFSAGLTTIVVLVVFLIVSAQIHYRLRSVLATEIGRGQQAMLQLHQRTLEQLLLGASVISQAPTLIAAVQTARTEGRGSPDRVRALATTVEGTLPELLDRFQKTLIVVTDDSGRVFAASSAQGGPKPAPWTDLSAMPAVRHVLDPNAPADARELGVLNVGDVLYQVGVFPMVQGGFAVGAVLLGESLDDDVVAAARRTTGGDVVVLRGRTVVASTRQLSAADVGALVDATAASDTGRMIRVADEDMAAASLRLGETAEGEPVRLWLIQPFAGAVADVTRRFLLVFAVSALVVAVVAGVGAASAARSVLRSFDRFVAHMGRGAVGEPLAARFDATDAAPEIVTLSGEFNRLMDSLGEERRLLERKTTELVAANAGLREEVRERERVERALHDSEAQLRQSQKLEAIGTLAGGIAHDFNNLLTVISGYSQLARARSGGDTRMAEDLRQVVEAADRAAKLTQQLLAFSRKQVLQPTVLDVGDVVEGLVPMLRPLIGEHIEVRVERQREVHRIFADRGQLEQVLINLVVNARDAMPSRGVLTIRTYADTDAGARLEVSDTGSGIPEAIRDRIFEPFFTTKDVGKGTGLGLSTVYGIVKQSGGTISVDSSERGTTFRIVLPPADALMPTDSVWMAEADAPRGTETILVVEDEDEVRLLARRTLEDRGYTVIAAASPEEALEIARAPGVDLILTDIVMPGMSGPELANRVAAAGGTPTVVYMSGYADEALQRFELGRGRVFLRKPFSPAGLARAIRHALDSAREPSNAT